MKSNQNILVQIKNIKEPFFSKLLSRDMSEVFNITWKIKSFEELSIHELYEILKVRQEVFVVEQTCYYLDADGYDQKALHLFAEKEGKVVAYCRIFPEGVKYPETSIGRVLTHPDFRNLKLGKTLISFALEAIKTRFNTTECRISAQDWTISTTVNDN